MSVSKEYMQQKYGHLGELVVVKNKNRSTTCIKVNCKNCGVVFFKSAFHCSESSSHFCNQKCSNSFNKTGTKPLDEYFLDFDGNYKPKHKCESYVHWIGMIKRVDSDSFKIRRPTYAGCTVSEDFRDFNFFHKWCLSQVGYGLSGYELDKDILTKGNKRYSDGTCCFVPREINTQFVKANKNRGEFPIGVHFVESKRKYCTQVKRKRFGRYLSYSNSVEEAFLKYKNVKEDYIKYLADVYKDSLDKKVYNALYAYEVEITD